jgi:hypothetical protein
MSAERYHHFKQVCADAGVTLRPDLAAAAEGQRQLFAGYAIGYYAMMLVANAYAAKLIREDNTLRLSDNPIPVDRLQGDVPSVALARTLNTARTPFFARASATYRLSNRPMQACPYAEDYFDATIMHRGQDSYGMQIFVNSAGTPQFVRKGFNRPLAMALYDIDVAGIDFMAGTLFNLDVAGDRYLGLEHEPSVPRNEVTVRSTESILSASPLRLSAYALPLEQRDEHFGAGIRDVSTLTMADIRETVAEIAEVAARPPA